MEANDISTRVNFRFKIKKKKVKIIHFFSEKGKKERVESMNFFLSQKEKLKKNLKLILSTT